jgi:hypothetical protein
MWCVVGGAWNLNTMDKLSGLLAEAGGDEFHCNAERSARRAAARNVAPLRASAPMPSVTLRAASPDDEPALKRLASFDSADLPTAPVLLAEVGGQLRAALSLRDDAIAADPFHPTAALEQLLVRWSKQGLGIRSPRLRRLLESYPGRQAPASRQLASDPEDEDRDQICQTGNRAKPGVGRAIVTAC